MRIEIYTVILIMYFILSGKLYVNTHPAVIQSYICKPLLLLVLFIEPFDNVLYRLTHVANIFNTPGFPTISVHSWL